MLKRRKEYFQALTCLLLLFAVPLIIATPTVMRGEAPLNFELLTTRAPWQEARAPGFEPGQEEDYAILIERYYPWYAFINQAGTRRELPLWNPYEGFGAPFMALWRTRALSPFSLPLYFSSLHAALGVSVFLKLCVAGLCAYYAARRFHFTPPYALLIGLTFQMSGPLLVGHWRPVSDVMPWFPLLFPCMQRLLLGDYRVWPWLALLVGVMTLGGDPETLAAVLLFSFLLIPVSSLRNYKRPHTLGAITVLAWSALIGLGLAGLQLAPHWEFLRFGDIEVKTTDTFIWPEISALLAPLIRSQGFARGPSLWLPAGTVAFLLIPLWLAVRPHANRMRRRRLESLLLTSFLTMAAAPILASWIRRTPGLSHFDWHHLMVSYPLAFAFLAATAVDEWVHLDADKCKAALKKLVGLLPVFWGAAFLAAYILARRAAPDSVGIGVLGPSALVAVAILLILAITLLWPRPTLTAYAFALMTALFLWHIHHPFDQFTPEARVFPETKFIHTLREQHSRVAGTARLQRWPLAAHEIAQIFSPSGVYLERSQQFVTQTENRPELLRLSGASALLLTRQDVQGGFAALRPVLNLQEVFPSGAILMKDLQAHPRARITHTGRALTAEESPVLRASGPPLLEGGTLPASVSGPANATAVLNGESLNRVIVSVDSGRPGVLILADAWYPGWQAVVEDNVEPVFPVDVAFRGVEISEGRQEVVFRYQPLSLKIGLYITAASGVIVILGLYNLFRRRLHA